MTAPLDTRTPTRLPRRIPVGLVILAAALPMFMATLDNLVMTNALPAIRLDLDASIEELQWFMNAYTLAFASFILMSVALGDRYGRRTVFAVGIGLFTLASAAAALATDPTQLIVARVVQGLGGAAVMPLSLSLLAGAVPDARRPLAIGIWGGTAGLGVALGPLIGGAVVEGWDWNAIFWINVPIGIIAIPLVLALLPNPFGRRQRPDVLGLILAGLGVLGLVWGIVRGNDAGWDSAEVLTGLVGGGLLLVLFVLWQRRAAAPLLPLGLFRDRSFTVANVVGLGFSFGMFGAVFILIQYLQIVRGYSPLGAGLATAPWTMAPMIIAPLAGLVAPRVGTRLLILAGLLFQAGALTWLGLTMAVDTPYSEMVGPFIMAGVGMGLVFAPSSTAVLANIAPADTAKASGTNSTIREVGVALGIAVLTAVFTGAGGELTPTGYIDAAIPAVLTGAGVVAATAVASLLLPAGRSVATRAVEEIARESDAPAEVAA
ncbi:DHA2 family efflux MFS transporter permease subunit [Homoserinibacter sp. GY 40078]|uniref:DHA2 family efflux MFS transporter permease subunit n=1 Tax=Homoserinibacter sp. GY 40078 TaxID=2603275 RepID=UPI0011CCB4D7|nr:DHA2 family efflux MFS transporter permease subunit [Homoserinibacter sp. GY 40078]TXK17320.1 DHA2 family efflux MFS transporter permease subunit [Homoserinibacter sp. GY 40078]